VGTSSIVGAARRLASISSGGDELENPGIDVSGVPFGNLFAVGASTSNFSALITLLNTQGDAQVLSSPRVSTVNNQKAVIKVGTDEYFVTDISSDTVVSAGGTTSNPDLTLTPFFSGIALDVTPQISAEGQVILHIHPSVSRVVDQQKTITLGGEEFDLPLAFSTVRESDSVVKARNGEVIVIGGLMQNLSNDEDAGVPGASEVPYAGNLFKQKSNLNRRTELVILLRPIVVDSEGIWSNYIQQSADRVKQLRAPPAEGE
jgi:MSHA biogenesis protein MshL